MRQRSTYHPTPPPTELRSARWRLRPLAVADTTRDFTALTAARRQLLLRSAGRWPQPGFTLAENRADLSRHQREHADRVALTYTILEDLAGTAPHDPRCLGCVYFRPLAQTLEQLGAAELAAQQPAAASDLTYWTIPEMQARGHDRELHAALLAWLPAFAFQRVWLVANDAEPRVTALAEADALPMVHTVRHNTMTWRLWRAYERP